MKKLNILSTGRYPVYVGVFADGNKRAMSFPTCARKYAKDGTIEFENGRRLVDIIENPPYVFKGIKAEPSTKPHNPLVSGYVLVSPNEKITDPMTDAVTKKRTTAKDYKTAIKRLLNAIERGNNNLDAINAAKTLIQ